MSDTAFPIPESNEWSRPPARVDWRAFLRTHKLLLILLGSVSALFLIVAMSTVVISSQPGFCIGCHEIRPAYDQWRTSAHSTVTCLQCHAEPGLPGYLKVNTAGAAHIITHLVSDYRLPEEADVRDTSCLNCHPRDSRPEKSLKSTLIVAHSKHDKQQCADCHGRLVHVSPAAQVSTAPREHTVRECSACHTPQNYLPHGDATLACTSCHSAEVPKHQPLQVRGVMPRQNCQECHAKAKVGSPEYCPTCHVSPHGVSLLCSQCHQSQSTWTEHTFNHPIKLVGQHTNVNCAQCHGTKTLAGLKYNCSSCHTPPDAHQGSPDNCATCHSEGGWKPVSVANHTFPQTHAGGAATCATCHPQSNFKTADCRTCHTKAAIDPKHAAKGMAAIDGACILCHPNGKKP